MNKYDSTITDELKVSDLNQILSAKCLPPNGMGGKRHFKQFGMRGSICCYEKTNTLWVII